MMILDSGLLVWATL